MSRHLLSKKYWLALIVLPCIFFAMIYVVLDYVEQRIIQLEIPIVEVESQQNKEESDLVLQEAAIQKERALTNKEINKTEWNYPCKIQMRRGIIGVYTENEECITKLKQVGEGLSYKDQLELQQGIWVANEYELIMLLESFHLQ